MRHHLVLLLAPLALALAACGGEDGPSARTIGSAPPAPAALTRSGGCGDAYLWAATEDGTVALTVSVDAADRSSTEPTTIDVDLADPEVDAFVLRGESDLTVNFCTDVIEGDAEPDSTEEVTAGTGRIVLDPTSGEGIDACGDRSGTADLVDVETESGTTFPAVTIETTGIGCDAG